jgi:hypothetical protein
LVITILAVIVAAAPAVPEGAVSKEKPPKTSWLNPKIPAGALAPYLNPPSKKLLNPIIGELEIM